MGGLKAAIKEAGPSVYLIHGLGPIEGRNNGLGSARKKRGKIKNRYVVKLTAPTK